MASVSSALEIEQPRLVFFHSTLSGHCRRVEGFLAQVLQRRRNHGTFRVVRVAEEERPDLLDKGEFQGRAGLERDRAATALRLTSVVLESGGDDASGAPLSVDGAEVGFVTQAIVSPYLGGKTLGLAKVNKEHAKAGTKVTARVGEESVGGEIVRHPVYDPERKRAKES